MTSRADIIETLQKLIIAALDIDDVRSSISDGAIDDALQSMDSLGAMRLIILIRDEFNVEVAPVDLFLCDNVSELSKLLMR